MTFYLLIRIISNSKDKSTIVYLSTINQKTKDEIVDVGLGPFVKKRKIYLVDEYGISHKCKEWEYVEYLPLKVRKYCIVMIKDKAKLIQEGMKRAKKFIKIYNDMKMIIH